MITYFCQNTQTKGSCEYGTSLLQIIEKENISLENRVLGATVNNLVRDLNYRVHKPCQIEFFDFSSQHGYSMYCRSLYFVLFKAVSDLLPNVRLRILHSISGGKFCALDGLDEPITDELAGKLKAAMQDIVKRDLPFIREEMPTEEAVAEYIKHGMNDKTDLLPTRRRIYTSVYHLDDKVNYYYGYLVPSTGYLTIFDLEKYDTGLLLKIPSRKRPDTLAPTKFLPKLFAVYQQYKDWAMRMGIPYVKDLNEKIASGEITDLIRVGEVLQENHFADIAQQITDKKTVKLVMIAGPSSSGKTSTCKRLSVQLMCQGYSPVQVSVDDFFVERDQTPLDANGEYDFEALEAIDLQLFNDTLLQLMEGKEVELPTFDFTQGKKIWTGKRVQMKPNSILIIEGIHCLNPKLTAAIPDEVKFRIFVSALTSISIDSQNPIPTTDNRLIRRIVRDYKYRGYSALDTIRRWPSVRKGEAKNIFPYQENADVMVNSALIFELGILKPYAIPALMKVPETVPEFAEAYRLLKFLSYFQVISQDNVPDTSILREFVGGSHFEY